MAEIALDKAIKLALKIQKQVKTVRQNEEECQDIEEDVAVLLGILSLLQQKPEVISHPAISGALLGLERSLDRALNLVTDCHQSRSLVRRFLRAGDLSKQLLKVHNDIKWKMEMGVFATNVLQLELTVTLTNTIHYSGGAHPALTHPQDAGVAEISHSSPLTTDDASNGRSGVNSSEITVVEMESAVPHGPPSRLSVFNSSESKETMHHFTEENISGDGHSFVLKQKIVIRIKINMSCDKSRSNALTLVARVAGVSSVGISGDGRDQLEVLGDCVDIFHLFNCLRKKIGHAHLLSVEEVKEEKPVGPEAGARKSKKGWTMACRMVWRKLRRGNKARVTAAAAKGQGRGSSRLHHRDAEDED